MSNDVNRKIKWLKAELAREKKAGHKNAVNRIKQDIATLQAVKGR